MNMARASWSRPGPGNADLRLEDGCRVAVVGGGPAGSFFSYFLLDMAERIGRDLQVEVYEPRDFNRPGPVGCNMCGGIVSESLVQALAAEGIELPPTVVQRGIDSYVLHVDAGAVRIETPLHEMRIGAVHRGPGPRDLRERVWTSFDGYLQALAEEKGARVRHEGVGSIDWEDGRPRLTTQGGDGGVYDLVVLAVGVNANAMKLLQGLGWGYRPPRTAKTCIREFNLGEEGVARYLGTSMHVFLLDIPRLEFAALIPKGHYATLCLLGEGIDAALLQDFMEAPEVKACLPPGVVGACQCSPRINVAGGRWPFRDRVVLVGDCAVTRLFKDGIGAAYRTAKAAAKTALFHGVSETSFRRHYWPVCRAIGADNAIGKVTFAVTRQIQKRRFARKAVLRMARSEQEKSGERRRMSKVLWDMFTGSAPYRQIFVRTLSPVFLGRLAWDLAVSLLPSSRPTHIQKRPS